MTAELVAHFDKHFPSGTTIRAELIQAADGFSVTVLFGPSGCGKTTILRCLAGLERPERGTIRFGDQTWLDTDRAIYRTPQERDVGFLFQDYALFPHLNVEKNIGYGLASVPALERGQRVAEMLHLFGLGGLERRYPHQVSGGQQQRIALARVLVRRPRLLLLDEPLSALDATLRDGLRSELRRQLEEFGIPVVLVTHDRTEAIALADQVVVLQDGMVRQQGKVQDVFGQPADPSVAHTVGIETIEPARIVRVENGLATVTIRNVQLICPAGSKLNGEAYACIRAEDVVLRRDCDVNTNAHNQLPVRVTAVTPEGPMVRVGLDCGFPLTSLVARPVFEELKLRVGDSVFALLNAPAIHLIPRG